MPYRVPTHAWPERGGTGRTGGVRSAAQDGPGARPSRPHRAAGGGRVEQHRHRRGAGRRQAHGRQVARALRKGPARRAPGPAPQRRPAHGHGRAGRRAAGPHTRGHARERHPLEHPLDGRGLRSVAGHGAAGLARLRPQAAPDRGLHSSPPTPSSPRRSGTSSGCISARPTGRWCCAWTRRPRCRRSSAPSPCCRCARASRSGAPRTTSGTAPRPCSPPWTWRSAG